MCIYIYIYLSIYLSIYLYIYIYIYMNEYKHREHRGVDAEGRARAQVHLGLNSHNVLIAWF